MAHTTHHQLFGPGEATRIDTTNVGLSALNNTFSKKFWFNLGTWTPVLQARWILVWRSEPLAPVAALLHWDNGPANIASLGSTTPPSARSFFLNAVDITTNFNALITGATAKNIGFVLNNPLAAAVYESHLEITWT